MRKIIKLDIEGNSEVERIVGNTRRTHWNSYIGHVSNNMAHLQWTGYMGSELELETVIEELNTIAIVQPTARLRSSPYQGNVPLWSRKLARRRTEVRKLFNIVKLSGD